MAGDECSTQRSLPSTMSLFTNGQQDNSYSNAQDQHFQYLIGENMAWSWTAREKARHFINTVRSSKLTCDSPIDGSTVGIMWNGPRIVRDESGNPVMSTGSLSRSFSEPAITSLDDSDEETADPKLCDGWSTQLDDHLSSATSAFTGNKMSTAASDSELYKNEHHTCTSVTALLKNGKAVSL